MVTSLMVFALLSVVSGTKLRHTHDETIMSPITVSGISAGAFMAAQFHVAFSSKVEGVGVLAGGPFYCAMDSESLALSRCMTEPQNINVEELVSITHSTFTTTGSVDDPANMANDKVWVLSAMNDTVVDTGVVQAVEEYYQCFVTDTAKIMSVYDEEGEHAYLTTDQGSECTYLGDPYINACDFDAAGSILNHILDFDLVDPSGEYNGLDLGSLVSFDQTAYLEVGYTVETSSLNQEGFAYVPNSCVEANNTDCRVHVAFHGCEQSIDDIGESFLLMTGYNRWAAANDIIILYPQTTKTVLNPKGCFDWWGYTGTDYASKVGVQMNAVNAMVNDIDQIIVS